MKPYFTIVLAWSDRPTIWHPTEETGPFAVLCRGAFPTLEAAAAWARANIPGHEYTIRRYRLESRDDAPEYFGPFTAEVPDASPAPDSTLVVSLRPGPQRGLTP